MTIGSRKRTPLCSATGALAAALLLLPSLALAGGMKVDPGKWEIHSIARMSMMPTPRESTQTQCVRESEMKPGEFLKDEDGCRVSDVVAEKARMAWTLVCDSGGGRMSGDAEFHSTGSTMKGRMTLTMKHGGIDMTVVRIFDGRRVGDCD
ncbi:MAG: DUF3617 family protein [Myxococcales bacterium]|nr:DUF3617 family protein [Myxococcales bacterium]